MTRVGFARESTSDQALEIQIAKLRDPCYQVVRSEASSGGPRSGHVDVVVEKTLKVLRGADDFFAHRPDRLI